MRIVLVTSDVVQMYYESALLGISTQAISSKSLRQCLTNPRLPFPTALRRIEVRRESRLLVLLVNGVSFSQTSKPISPVPRKGLFFLLSLVCFLQRSQSFHDFRYGHLSSPPLPLSNFPCNACPHCSLLWPGFRVRGLSITQAKAICVPIFQSRSPERRDYNIV